MADSEELAREKRRMREVVLARRAAMDPRLLTREARLCADAITSSALWGCTSTVLAYVSLPGELTVDGLIDEALATGRRVLVPRVERARRLSWHELPAAPGSWREDLVAGTLSIPEPQGEGLTLDEAVGEGALMVCPAVALDPGCRRLGHGGGYYDRQLAHGLEAGLSLTTVGVVPSGCVVDLARVTGPQDRAVGAVVVAGELIGGTLG